MLNTQEIENLLKEIKHAGLAALQINNSDFRVDTKSDESPVTEADHLVSRILVKYIKEQFPTDLVVSEEVPEKVKGESDRVWYIDPIDGTKDFVQKNGEWSVIVGLAHQGRPVFGAIYQPQSDILYYGLDGRGAFCRVGEREQKISVRHFETFNACIMVSSRNHPSPRLAAFIEKIGVGQKYIHGSVGIKIGHVAEGRADVYINVAGKANTWDYCGPDAILREAGGVLLTFQGNQISYSPWQHQVTEPIIAASKDFATAIRQVLATE
jgi:3'(2'), 5'-bisphosphate nucleotidase